MEIKRIVPVISSNNLEASKLFYQDFLGLKLAMDMGWILTFISESNPLSQISVVRSERIIDNYHISITIEVANVNVFFTKAEESNYKIIYHLTDEPWGVQRFFVEDPNGVTINIMSHR